MTMTGSGHDQRLLHRVIEAIDRPVIGVTASAEIASWNRAATAVLGYSETEAVGQSVSLILKPGGPTAAELLELGGWDAGSSSEPGRAKLELATAGVATSREVSLRSREGTSLRSDVTVVAVPGGGALLLVGGIEFGAVAALRESEARYRALVELSPDAIVVHSGGKIVYMNRTGLELIGAAGPDDVIGRPALDFIHPDYVALAGERMRQAYVDQLHNPVIEERMFRMEGSVVDVEIAGAPITFDGAPANQVVIRDITARKRDEAQLRLLSLVVEQSSEGIAVADLDGQLLFSNDAHAAMHGYTADELVGRHLSMLHGPDHMAAVDAANRQIKTSGEFRGEIWHRHRDGHDFPTIMHNSLLRDEQGVPIGLIGTLRDITEQVGAERALRESEERYRNLVELSPDPVVVLQDERYQFVNTSFTELFGYDRADVAAGLSFFDLVDEEDRDAVAARYQARLNGQAAERTTRIDLLTKNGRVIPCETSATRIQHQGRPADLVIIRDISERERAEEERLGLVSQVLQAQKLESLGVLACGIAHDFNNLLVGVLTNAGLARRRLPDNDPVRRSIDSIELAAQRAAELCHRLLAYAGRGEILIQEVDVTAVIEEMIELLHLPLSGRVVLDRQLDRELPPIAADVTQLRQVVMNLIANAAEAIGDEAGQVTVRTRVVDGRDSRDKLALRPLSYVCIEVADDGSGMDPSTLKRVFDPFFTTKVAGRGLGLATVQGFVRAHNGVVDISSAVGKGSCFRVFLPTGQPLGAEVPQPSVATPTVAAVGAVMVVDDEDLVRNVVVEILEQEGLGVIAAADGFEALELFLERQDEIGLVLVDMSMPRMNGDELFRRLREIEPKVRVLFASGYHEGNLGEVLAADDRVGFIRKPFRIDELIERIRDLMP